MKKFVMQMIGLIIVIFIGLYFTAMILRPNTSIVTSNQPILNIQKAELVIKDSENNQKVAVNVDIADTDSERRQGLGGRSSLPENEGMLFVFDSERVPVFWMKGLNFNLDFLWIKGNKIVDLAENIPKPQENVLDNDLPRYQPNSPVDKVLEVNSGFIGKNNIQIGDTIELVSQNISN